MADYDNSGMGIRANFAIRHCTLGVSNSLGDPSLILISTSAQYQRRSEQRTQLLWDFAPDNQTFPTTRFISQTRNGPFAISSRFCPRSTIYAMTKNEFYCINPSCDTKLFSGRSDLKWHQREVHHGDEDGNPSLSTCEGGGQRFAYRLDMPNFLL